MGRRRGRIVVLRVLKAHTRVEGGEGGVEVVMGWLVVGVVMMMVIMDGGRRRMQTARLTAWLLLLRGSPGRGAVHRNRAGDIEYVVGALGVMMAAIIVKGRVVAPLLLVVVMRAISRHQRHQIVSEIMVGVIAPAPCARGELAKGVCGGGGGNRKALGGEEIVDHVPSWATLARIPVVGVRVGVVVGVAWRRGIGGREMEALDTDLGLVRGRRGVVKGHLTSWLG